MRSIERLTSEPTVCFIDWLTPGAQKFKLEKIEALSEYLLSLNCLPIWVNFPRSDDLGNERECYSQVSSHCERWNLPFVDVYKDSRVSSLDIEELLRDKVHTTPLGGKVYAQVLFDFIRALDVKFQLERINRDDHKSSLVAPTLIDKKFTLKTGMRIDVGFNSPNDTNFELYFLSEIGPYTPVLELSFLNVKTKETQSHIVNCLDKWSHYNRKKCIKVLWMKIVAGEYRLSVRAVNTPAIEEIDIKKPVDQERYPEGEPLHLPVEQLSCNVKLLVSLLQRNNMYKPSYVWPNPAFPFRVYFESEKLRIFIIENIQHNWNWLKEYSSHFKGSDYFFVYCGWYHSEFFAKEANTIFNELGLNKDNFYFMYNQLSEEENFEALGFKGELINQNCWLDESLVMKPLSVPKQYDAIYVGRFSAFKRHHLASRVSNLALVAGNNHGNAIAEGIPQHIYLNETPLTPEQVCEKINQAKCGLILSEQEGACFASSEYLLCGVPVVSTPELGGRSAWYDDYNSITCEPHEDAVFEAVQFFIDNPREPALIRERHICKANYFRARFILKFAELLDKHRVVGVNPFQYFKDNYVHKLRKSFKPDFKKIFLGQ